MKNITMTMINMYKLKEAKCDFMGYNIHREQSLNFHHLIIPRRHGGKEIISNGAILNRDTSHDYLHKIEIYDQELFAYITSEMIDMNVQGRLTKENLLNIRELLEEFERKYKGATTRKGHLIILPEYIEDRLDIERSEYFNDTTRKIM